MKSLCEGYMILMLKDYELSSRELEYLKLSKQDLTEMAAPLASMANRNKYMRKHGREIIAAADSYEAVLAMMIWMRRVNKVARAHKAQERANQPKVAAPTLQERVASNGSAGSDDRERAELYKPSAPNPAAIFNLGAG